CRPRKWLVGGSRAMPRASVLGVVAHGWNIDCLYGPACRFVASTLAASFGGGGLEGCGLVGLARSDTLLGPEETGGSVWAGVLLFGGGWAGLGGEVVSPCGRTMCLLRGCVWWGCGCRS